MTVQLGTVIKWERKRVSGPDAMFLPASGAAV
jgi:hypothetical protein